MPWQSKQRNILVGLKFYDARFSGLLVTLDNTGAPSHNGLVLGYGYKPPSTHSI